MERATGLLVAAVQLLIGALSLGAETIDREWLMYRDPVLSKPRVEIRFPPGLPELWLQALERPERDLKRRAAGAIAVGHRKGLQGLEITIGPLIALLKEKGQDRAVRLAAAQALTELDARQAAPLLFELLRPDDLEMAEIVEPALAKWRHPPAGELFLKRLGQPSVPRRHVLAIRGLVEFRDDRAWGEFLKLARDSAAPVDVRLEAARALGQLQDSKLEGVARELMKRQSSAALIDRLVASHLLKSHRGEETVNILTELARDSDPAVQTIALSHLFAIDPELIMPTVESNIASRDASVRDWVAKALVARPSVEKLRLLASLLDDPHPGIRQYAGNSMFELSRNEPLREVVLEEGRQMLENGSWRGLEQSIVLLVAMEDKSITDRLLELLEAERAEVHATAAWGLARLSVKSTAEAILKVFAQRTDFALAGDYRGDQIYLQACHLAQALGQMQYEPADEYLRKYVPKGQTLMTQARASAIWALGKLHAGNPDAQLSKRLRERLVDINSMVREKTEVRTMAAVALGRMQATDSVDALRKMEGINRQSSSVGHACIWAIHELTGEPIPQARDNLYWEADWFLVPVDETTDD